MPAHVARAFGQSALRFWSGSGNELESFKFFGDTLTEQLPQWKTSSLQQSSIVL